MIKARYLLLLLLTGCAQFGIDGTMFAQERMAHAATGGTMYLTSAWQDGNHDCDATPSNCCATGYHMCSHYEILQGDRRIEYSGTGRDTTPYGGLGAFSAGQVVAGGNISTFTAGADCNSYTNTSAFGYFTWCAVDLAGAPSCEVLAACSSTVSQWCCSD